LYSPSHATEIDGKVNARAVTLRSSFNEPLPDFGSDFFSSFFAFFAPSRGYYCLPFAALREISSVFVFLVLGDPSVL
jgi:hypothetical protein